MSEYLKKKQPVQPSQAKKAEPLNPMQEMTNGIPNSVLQDIFAGKRKADASMTGHSDTLAPSIAAKMSRAFGMDVSSVQVSRSDKMKGTGMQGMAQGNKVVLSSDIDLNTMEGQAILGHELSHIRAQSQGIGMGNSGLYQNASLEHQADMEGMRAARGLFASREGGMEMGLGMSYGLGMRGLEGLTPLSGGMSANAGAPMQAKKPDAPGSEMEANQMMYDFATERAKQLRPNLYKMSDKELLETKKNEDAELEKYARSLSIPKSKLTEWEHEAHINAYDKKRKKEYIKGKKEEYYKDLMSAARGRKEISRYSRLYDEYKNKQRDVSDKINASNNSYEQRIAASDLEVPGKFVGGENRNANGEPNQMSEELQKEQKQLTGAAVERLKVEKKKAGREFRKQLPSNKVRNPYQEFDWEASKAERRAAQNINNNEAQAGQQQDASIKKKKKYWWWPW